MAARRGYQYLEGLKDDREVWYGDEKIDITTHPAFAGTLRGMADFYEWQHKYADDCLVDDPEQPGEVMSAAFLIPKSPEDIQTRHRAFDRFARYSYGMLGRTPDYIDVVLAGHAARKDIYDKSGDPVYYERLWNYYRHVVENDLALTHTIVHAAIDKGAPELAGMNAPLTLRVIERTDAGLIVRGAKMLATLGPIADELYVYPATPIQPGFEEYALSFAIPVSTKGVVTICRDHYGVEQDVADRPFSSRFDEQDSVVIFNDVLVPWDRVFIDGNLDVYNSLNAGTATGNTQQQTSIRASVKLEFAYDLLSQIATVTNSHGRPDVAAQLGEVWTYLTLTKALIHDAEARAFEWGPGAFFIHDDIGALRGIMPVWMTRVNDIIKALGSHNLFATPTQAAFDNPELGPLLEEFLPGAGGVSARDRARIMRTAWDFAGSGLGSRIELYEKFYLGSVDRGRGLLHRNAQKNSKWGQVFDFLAEAEAETAWDPSMPPADEKTPEPVN